MPRLAIIIFLIPNYIHDFYDYNHESYTYNNNNYFSYHVWVWADCNNQVVDIMILLRRVNSTIKLRSLLS